MSLLGVTRLPVPSARESHGTWKTNCPEPCAHKRKLFSLAKLRRRRPCVCQARPTTVIEVVQWATREFYKAVARTRSDHTVNVAYVCMLIALEEEAAAYQARTVRPQVSGSATWNTWSSKQLDRLAVEVATLLSHESFLQVDDAEAGKETAVKPVAAGAVGHREAGQAKDTSTKTTDLQQPAPAREKISDKLPTARGRKLTGASGPAAANEVEAAKAPKQKRRNADLPLVIKNRDSNMQPQQTQQPQQPETRPARAIVEVAKRPEATKAPSQGKRKPRGKSRPGLSPVDDARLRSLREVAERYPIQVLQAINTILFDWHGYSACNRDSRYHRIMENGVGSSAALSLLYALVCGHVGLRMAVLLVEDGRYFLLWPMHSPLTLQGQAYLIDPYGGGALLPVAEVCEMFGLKESELVPAPRRQLLFALLAKLRDGHWARAVGCKPTRSLLTPLTPRAVLNNTLNVVSRAALARAAAAAEKCAALLPRDRSARLDAGLLYYLQRRYDDAWLELSSWVELCTETGHQGADTADMDDVMLLLQKVQLELAMASISSE